MKRDEYAIVAKIPNCELCEEAKKAKKAVYDARTRIGPWAYLCQSHFDRYGIGLGLGYGQVLILQEEEERAKKAPTHLDFLEGR